MRRRFDLPHAFDSGPEILIALALGNRIAVRFQYESHDAEGQWWRSYGNELWEFDGHGLMTRREASINDVPIEENQRRILGPRPEAERGRSFPLA